MTASQIAETYVNGNITDAREALCKRRGKTVVLDFIEALAYEQGHTLRTAISATRSLLRGA